MTLEFKNIEEMMEFIRFFIVRTSSIYLSIKFMRWLDFCLIYFEVDANTDNELN